MEHRTEIAVPARTELGGNHTDHQGGRVLAAGIALYLRAEVQRAEAVTVCSGGFGRFTMEPGQLATSYSRAGTAEALCRGVLAYLRKAGVAFGGFRAEVRSEIPAGAGLSSSAAFGVLMGRCVSQLYCGGELPPLLLARAAQYGENVHFGKPCGLMDQCACALGGVQLLDLAGAEPQAEAVETALFAPDYCLLLVDTGSGHADLTDAYGSIPREMGAVAAAFGQTRLRDVPEAAVRAEIPALRRRLGDRAVLRALHYYEEDRRVPELADALRRGDAATYLDAMDASGRSSAECLQNSAVDPAEQPISLGLSLCRRALGRSGAARVHGGGFAGMLQVLAPADSLPLLAQALEPVFGTGCIKAVQLAAAAQ